MVANVLIADPKTGYWVERTKHGVLVDFEPKGQEHIKDIRHTSSGGPTPWWVHKGLVHTEFMGDSSEVRNFKPFRHKPYDSVGPLRILFGDDNTDISTDFDPSVAASDQPGGWMNKETRSLTSGELVWVNYQKKRATKSPGGASVGKATPVARKPAGLPTPRSGLSKEITVSKPDSPPPKPAPDVPKMGDSAKRKRAPGQKVMIGEDSDSDGFHAQPQKKKTRFSPPRDGAAPDDDTRLLFFQDMKRLAGPTGHGQLMQWENIPISTAAHLNTYQLPAIIPDSIPDSYAIIVNAWCRDHRGLRTVLLNSLLNGATEEEKELLKFSFGRSKAAVSKKAVPDRESSVSFPDVSSSSVSPRTTPSKPPTKAAPKRLIKPLLPKSVLKKKKSSDSGDEEYVPPGASHKKAGKK